MLLNNLAQRGRTVHAKPGLPHDSTLDALIRASTQCFPSLQGLAQISSLQGLSSTMRLSSHMGLSALDSPHRGDGGQGTSSSLSTRPGAAGTHAWWEHGLHPAPSPPPRERRQPLLYAHPLPGSATGQERSRAAELWIPCSPLPTMAEPPLVSRGRREGQHRLSMSLRAGKRHSLVIHNPVLFQTHDLASPQRS